MQEHLDGISYDGRFIVADAKLRLDLIRPEQSHPWNVPQTT
jgi:hypothetical protein